MIRVRISVHVSGIVSVNITAASQLVFLNAPPSIPGNAISIQQAIWTASSTRWLFTECVRSCMALVISTDQAVALAHIPDRFAFSFETRKQLLLDNVNYPADQVIENSASLTALVRDMCAAVQHTNDESATRVTILGGVERSVHEDNATMRIYVYLWLSFAQECGLLIMVRNLMLRYGQLQNLKIAAPDGGDMPHAELFNVNPEPYLRSRGVFTMRNINKAIMTILSPTNEFFTDVTTILQGGMLRLSPPDGPDFTTLKAEFAQSLLFPQLVTCFSNSVNMNSRKCTDEIINAAKECNISDIHDHSCTYVSSALLHKDGICVAVSPDGKIQCWSDKYPEQQHFTYHLPPQSLGTYRGFMFALQNDKLTCPSLPGIEFVI